MGAFLAANFWWIILLVLFFGKRAMQNASDIFLQPILEHRLAIEKERTRQARLDAQIEEEKRSLPKVEHPYEEGYLMEQKHEL